MNIFTGIFDTLVSLVDIVKTFFSVLVNGIWNFVGPIFTWFGDAIELFTDGVSGLSFVDATVGVIIALVVFISVIERILDIVL